MSGGYRLAAKTYVLKFEDHPGLEVSARSVPVGELLKILELADAMTSDPTKAQVTELFTWFAKRLIGWNLEDEDGTPVPATAAGLLGLDFDFAMALVMAWTGAVSSVKLPLVQAPADGMPPGPVPMTPRPPPSSATGT